MAAAGASVFCFVFDLEMFGVNDGRRAYWYCIYWRNYLADLIMQQEKLGRVIFIVARVSCCSIGLFEGRFCSSYGWKDGYDMYRDSNWVIRSFVRSVS